MLDEYEFGRFLEGYLICLLWSTVDGDTECPLDDTYGVEDLHESARKKAFDDCCLFVNKSGSILIEACERIGYSVEHAGHDFWLTRNGHGCGFWDREPLEEDDFGRKLTEIANTFPNIDPYAGDDGLIYFQ